MILHIGSDEFVPLSSIVAVLDVCRTPQLMAGILPSETDGGIVKRVGAEETKSVVITASEGRCVFFLSPVSAQTLRRRMESGSA